MATGKGRSVAASRPSNAPAFNAADIRNALARYDRGPFLELLAKMVELFPNDDSLKALAMKKPELFISSMIAMARISGFTEKQEVFHEHTVNVHKMSDSQLEDHAASLARQLGFGKTVDITPNENGELPIHAPRGGETTD